MASTEELRNMIYSFRVSELQDLLGFAGRNKTGKKQELQSRALDLLKLRSAPVQMKVIELHKRRFHVMNMVPGNAAPAEPPLKVPSMGVQVERTAHSMSPRTNVMPSGLTYGSSVNYPSVQRKPLPLTAPSTISSAAYPIHPDVKLKPLPFYDVLSNLLQPSSLSCTRSGSFQENHFQFCLSPGQVNNIAMSRDYTALSNPNDYGIQIQLRFCLLETSCEQDDNFPPSICVKVNNKMCQLPNPIPTNRPGVEPKRPSRPVNITNLCKLSAVSPNHILVSWASEYSQAYAISVYLVRRLDAATLLSRLRSKGMRNPDHTRAMIKEKLEQSPDSEIATTSLRGSLICPIGKMKMQIPCRPITCTHLQCFDANLFLKMNEKKPRWICPVCDKPAAFTSLTIDGLFSEISAKAPSHCTEVQFHEDGSWTPIMHEKETHDVDSSFSVSSPIKKQAKKKHDIEVVDLTADSDTDDEWYTSTALAKKTPPFQVLGGSPSAVSVPPSLMYPAPKIPTTAAFISLPSPSSPSVITSFDPLTSSSSSTICSATSKSPVPSVPYPTSQPIPNLLKAGLSNNKDATVSSRNSMRSEAVYSGLTSYVDTFYDHSVSSPARNDLTGNSQSYMGDGEFDLFSLLHAGNEEQMITSMPNSSSSTRTNTSTPDIISLD